MFNGAAHTTYSFRCVEPLIIKVLFISFFFALLTVNITPRNIFCKDFTNTITSTIRTETTVRR